MESSENKENITRGCLKLKDKIYPVYDGLNPVGRNPDAIVNIKNLNVSKYHAVITVFDNDGHYISDFKSSNGTVLNNNKLNPFQLYKINDGASIKFGDVFCTYKKLEVGYTITKSLQQSQQYSESFYGASTQQVQITNVPDGINFNELPTQVFSMKDLSINEMPTQIQPFMDLHESSNDSIDFLTMQKSTESQLCNLSRDKLEVCEKTAASSANSDTDDKEPISVNKDNKSEESQKVCPVHINARQMSDSETDDELTSVNKDNKNEEKVDIARKNSDSETDDESIPSQVQPVISAKKNVIESDSSDTEEYLERGGKSKYHISDDSETDIEEETKNEEKTNSVLPEENNEDASGLSLRLVVSDSEDSFTEKRSRISKKRLPQDHLYCQSFSQTQEDVLKDEGKEIEPGTKLEESTNSERKIEEEKDKNEQSTEQRVENQDQSSDGKHAEEVEENANPESRNRNEEKEKNEDEDDLDQIFDRATQFDFDEVNTNKEKPTLGESSDLQSKEAENKKTEENIFDQPTQEFNLDFVNDIRSEERDETSKNNIEDGKASNLHLREKQETNTNNEAVATNVRKDKIEEENTPDDLEDYDRKKIDQPSTLQAQEETNEDEDIFDLPTQQLNPGSGKGYKKTDIEKNVIEDVFLQPTQTLDFFDEPDRFTNNTPTFALPQTPSKKGTPKKQTKKSTMDDDDDSFLLPPTQALEVLHDDGTHFNKVEDELHEIFASQSLLCTQQLMDVLNTSKDEEEIIDASVLEESRLSFRKSAPLSVESVKQILAEDVEGEALAINRESRSNLKTYSKHKIEELEEKEDKGPDVEVDGEDKWKGGRRKQEIGVSKGDLNAKEDENTKAETQASAKAKDSNSEGNKQKGKGKQKNENVGRLRTRGKQTDDEDEPERATNSDKSKAKTGTEDSKKFSESESKKEVDKNRTKRGKKQNKATSEDPESSIATKEDSDKDVSKTRRGKRAAKASESIETKKVEPSIRGERIDKQKPENETPENRTRGGRRTQDRESSVETTKSESQSSVGSNGTVKGKRTSRNAKSASENSNEGEPNRQQTSKHILKSEDTIVQRTRSKEKQDRESSVETTKSESQNSDDTVKRKRSAKIVKSASENSGKREAMKKSDTTVRRTRGNGKQNDERESSVETTRSESQNSDDAVKRKKTAKNAKSASENSSVEESEDTVRRTRGKSKESQDRESSIGRENRRKGTNTLKEEKIIPKEDSKDSVQPKRTRGRGKQNEEIESSDESQVRTKKTVEADIDKSGESKKGRKPKEASETPNVGTVERDDKPSTSRANKRKQNAQENTPQTPKKRQIDTSGNTNPRKRGLQPSSYDSEDDFEIKVPKVDNSVKSPKLRSPQIQEDQSEETIPLTPVPQRRLSANSRRQKREEQAKQTPLPTPERNRRVLKPKVVFTMMDNPPFESLIRQLGGSVIDSVDTCTVLVTECVKRTLKLLVAVGLGKPICSPQWLEACKKASSFVDPWDHICLDKAAEKKWKFSLRESLLRGGREKLLKNYTFQVIVNNGADVLKGAIEACGGKCVTRNLAKNDAEHLIVVSTPENKTKYSKVVGNNKKIKVVEPEAIFDGTLRQEFKFDNFLLIK